MKVSLQFCDRRQPSNAESHASNEEQQRESRLSLAFFFLIAGTHCLCVIQGSCQLVVGPRGRMRREEGPWVAGISLLDIYLLRRLKATVLNLDNSSQTASIG